MPARVFPTWLDALGDDDLQFVRRLLLASGSLKEVAAGYGISYPTVRIRLDRVIAKVKASDAATGADAFERRVRGLVADGTLPAGLGRELIESHAAVVAAQPGERS